MKMQEETSEEFLELQEKYNKLQSEFKNLEKQFQQVSFVQSAQENYVNSVSNDLMTQLKVLVGYSDVVSDIFRKDQVLSDCLRRIHNLADTIEEVVSEVVDISNIDMRNYMDKKYYCNIKYLLEDVYNICVMEAAKKQVHLYLDLSEVRDCLVCSDKFRLIQIFKNVIKSAVTMSPPGNIYIKLRQLDMVEKNKYIYEFTVSDSGGGLSEGLFKNIINPFSSEIYDQEFRDVAKAMYICKNLVQLLHGTMDKFNDCSVGTTVKIHLPILIQDNQNPEKEIIFSGKKILYLADEYKYKRDVEGYFESLGCVVDTTRDVQMTCDVLCEMSRGYYNLILMDQNMACWEDFVASRLIRRFEDRHVATLPIIIIGADEKEDYKHRAIECGISAFLHKPFQLNEVKEVLKELWRL